jgi:hypothetical protein
LSQFIVESTAHTQNELQLRLNQVTVQDSASIKVITVLTLIYLPASFVAVSLQIQPAINERSLTDGDPYLDLFWHAVLPIDSIHDMDLLCYSYCPHNCDDDWLVVVGRASEKEEER